MTATEDVLRQWREEEAVVLARLPAGHGAVVGKEPLRAIGKVLHCSRQLATAEGRIVDASGKLYAHATTTCLVFEMK